MTHETKIHAARMATDLTIALINDKHGYANKLKLQASQSIRSGDPLELFDAIYAHVLKTVQDEKP